MKGKDDSKVSEDDEVLKAAEILVNASNKENQEPSNVSFKHKHVQQIKLPPLSTLGIMHDWKWSGSETEKHALVQD